jgi:phosphate/sulfate permease
MWTIQISFLTKINIIFNQLLIISCCSQAHFTGLVPVQLALGMLVLADVGMMHK